MKQTKQEKHVAAVKAAGGSRRTFLLSADATDALARWKAHTGATSDREAVELALLAAVLRVGGAV